ncbi:hypothetical protein [Pseudarthrobacter sp. PS3-L1]|uniref:hypothetical protein n=1 Tax=Pseudarthrobacter sp. PS3-L1 TaxID=3046207 RepID=UPI0024BAAB04|nr:hypothetical protein [Pseudarthrobacter sp. PS3-L1]MDJ0319858.1 hypothetical protein [Pseudarthrobacter sp. PS3-L1]
MLLAQIATTISAAGEEHEELAPLWTEPWVFGVVMFGILMVLLLITFSYSNLGNRHTATQEHADPHRQHPNKHDTGH